MYTWDRAEEDSSLKGKSFPWQTAEEVLLLLLCYAFISESKAIAVDNKEEINT